MHCRNFIDGDLIEGFLELGADKQQAVSVAMQASGEGAATEASGADGVAAAAAADSCDIESLVRHVEELKRLY